MARRKKDTKLYISRESITKATPEQMQQNEHLLDCYARYIAAMPKVKRDDYFERLKKRHGLEFRNSMYERSKKAYKAKQQALKG